MPRSTTSLQSPRMMRCASAREVSPPLSCSRLNEPARKRGLWLTRDGGVHASTQTLSRRWRRWLHRSRSRPPRAPPQPASPTPARLGSEAARPRRSAATRALPRRSPRITARCVPTRQNLRSWAHPRAAAAEPHALMITAAAAAAREVVAAAGAGQCRRTAAPRGAAAASHATHEAQHRRPRSRRGPGLLHLVAAAWRLSHRWRPYAGGRIRWRPYAVPSAR